MNNYIKYLSIIILIILILYFYYYNNFKNTNIEHFSSSEIFDYTTWKYDKLLNKGGNVSYIYGYPQLDLYNTQILSYLNTNKNQYGENIIYTGDITSIDKTQKGYYLKNSKDLYVPSIKIANDNNKKTVNLCNEFVIEYKLNTKIIKEDDVYYKNENLGVDPNYPAWPLSGSSHQDLNNFLTDISILLINNYKCTTYNNYKVWKPVPYGLKWKKVSKADFDADDDVGRILNYHDYKALSTGTAVPFEDGFYGTENPQPGTVLYNRVYKQCKGWGIKKHLAYSTANKDNTNVYIQPNTRTAPIYIVAEDIKNRILKDTGSSGNTYNFEKDDWDYYNITDLRYNDYIYVSKFEPGNRQTDEYWKPIIDFGNDPHGIGTITDSNNITNIWRKSLSKFNKITKNDYGWALETASMIETQFTSLVLSKENLEYFINDMSIDNDKSIYDYYFQNANGVIYVPKLIPDLHNGYLTLKGIEDNEFFDEYSAISMVVNEVVWYTSVQGQQREKVKIIDIDYSTKPIKYKLEKEHGSYVTENGSYYIVKNNFNIISDLEYKYNKFVENKENLIDIFSNKVAQAAGLPSKTTCENGIMNTLECNICYKKDDYDEKLTKDSELMLIREDIADEIKYKYAISNSIITKNVIDMPAGQNFRVDDYIQDNSTSKYGTISSINQDNTVNIMYDDDVDITQNIPIGNIKIVDKITVLYNDGSTKEFGIIEDSSTASSRDFEYVLHNQVESCNVFDPAQHLSSDGLIVNYNGKDWFKLTEDNIGKIQDDNNFNVNYLTWENVGTTLPDSMKYDYVLSSSEVGTKIGKEIIIDNDTVKQKFEIKQTIGDQVDLIDNDLTHLSPNDNKNYFNYIIHNSYYYRPIDCEFENWISNGSLGTLIAEDIRKLYKNSQINCCMRTIILSTDEDTYSTVVDPSSYPDDVCISKATKTRIIDKVKNEKSKECLISKTDLDDAINTDQKFISINKTNRYNRDLTNPEQNLNPTPESWSSSHLLYTTFNSSTPAYGLEGESIGDYQKKSLDSSALKNKINEFDTSKIESLDPPYEKTQAILQDEFNFKFIDDHITTQDSNCKIKNIDTYTASDATKQNSFTHTWTDTGMQVTKSWGKTGKTDTSGDQTAVIRPDIADLASNKFETNYIYTKQDLYYENDTLCNADVSSVDDRKMKCLYSWVGKNMYDPDENVEEYGCAVEKVTWDTWKTNQASIPDNTPLALCRDASDQCTEGVSEDWVNNNMYILTGSPECGVVLTPALDTTDKNTIPVDYDETGTGTLSAFYKGSADNPDDPRNAFDYSNYMEITENDLKCPFRVNSDMHTQWCGEVASQSDPDYDKCCNSSDNNPLNVSDQIPFDNTDNLKTFKDTNYWPNVCAYTTADLQTHLSTGDNKLPQRDCLSASPLNTCYYDDGSQVSLGELYNFGKVTGIADSPYVNVTNCDIAEIYTNMAPIIKLKKIEDLRTAPIPPDDLYENQYLSDVINNLQDKDKGSNDDYITLTPVKNLTFYTSTVPDPDNTIDKEKLYKLKDIDALSSTNYTNTLIDTNLGSVSGLVSSGNTLDYTTNIDLIKMLNDYSIHIGLDYTYLKDNGGNYWNIVLEVEYWITLLYNIYNLGNSLSTDIFDISTHEHIITKNTDEIMYKKWETIKPYKIITEKHIFNTNAYWGYVDEPTTPTGSELWEAKVTSDPATYLEIAGSDSTLIQGYKDRNPTGCEVSKADLMDVTGKKLHIPSGQVGSVSAGQYYGWWPQNQDYAQLESDSTDYIKYENCAYKKDDPTPEITFTTRTDNTIRSSHRNKTYNKAGMWEQTGQEPWWHHNYNSSDDNLRIYTDPSSCASSPCTNTEKITTATGEFTTAGATVLDTALQNGKIFGDNGCYLKKCEEHLTIADCQLSDNCIWDSGSCYYNTSVNIPNMASDTVASTAMTFHANYTHGDNYQSINQEGINRYIADEGDTSDHNILYNNTVNRISSAHIDPSQPNSYYIRNSELGNHWPGFTYETDTGDLEWADVRHTDDKTDSSNSDTLKIRSPPFSESQRPDSTYSEWITDYCAVSKDDVKDTQYNKYILENPNVKGTNDDTSYNIIKNLPNHITVDNSLDTITWCNSGTSDCPNVESTYSAFILDDNSQNLREYGLYKYNDYATVSDHMYGGTQITDYNTYYTPFYTTESNLYSDAQAPYTDITIKDIYSELKDDQTNSLGLWAPDGRQSSTCLLDAPSGTTAPDEFQICSDGTGKSVAQPCADGQTVDAHYGRIIDSIGSDPLLYTNQQAHNYAKHKYSTILNQYANAELGGEDNPFCDETGSKRDLSTFKSLTSDKLICGEAGSYNYWDFTGGAAGEGEIASKNCGTDEIASSDEKWYNPYSDCHAWSDVGHADCLK